ncbi:hypothetical protein CDD82_834 [Ophiocordyceps australis]|uniref:GPI ethanolamine phosphate transferase 1 n=1 Tax=Ophiocordyceps australis TaxID=1399860 RepID=A0A2C5XQB7_9HYPO|nr:hypothetical protein CDD82_834 [Ophiocordyceps australis]
MAAAAGAVTRAGFLITAVVFHAVYIMSIFDIYFVSPIVSGMKLVGIERPSTVKPPADRLVLFVGDGLRADKAFQWAAEPYGESEEDLVPRPLAPFLRSRVLEHGTFGVSHTRVPTESRPGHVALIAGLYEDVSAVATGWKLNPVDFDSVFNRSRHTWSWGSPDILPMFERGAVSGRVDALTYEPDFEDFSQDATRLDYWVFDHVKDLFALAASNQTLAQALRQDRSIFFLHLLGLDTSGHAYRPYSNEYLYNIKVVDEGVEQVTNLFHSFFGDDRTAFVFTADHGMSDWGSHGDGHPDNTRTPLIAWGSGVARPEIHQDVIAPGHDEFSADWHLQHVRRHDVAQADVAALMAYLIGAEFPANSVGKLPLSYLSADSRDKATAFLANAQSILEMYRVKEDTKRANQIRFVPYPPLSEGAASPAQRLAAIRHLIESDKLDEAVEETDALITLTLEGLRYLQTYDWLFLRALITAGYLGWMVYATITVFDLFLLQQPVAPQRTPGSIVLFSSLFTAMVASFIVSHSPITYYAYAIFPVLFWEQAYTRRNSLVLGCRALFGHVQSAGAWLTVALHTVFYVAVIQCMALGYIHRQVFTAIYVLWALWPCTYGMSFVQKHTLLSAAWAVTCLAMSIFTLLPAIKVENVPLILAGGTIMAAVGLAYLLIDQFASSDSSPPSSRSSGSGPVSTMDHGIRRTLVGAQIGLILLAMAVTRSSALSLQKKQGLPHGNQIVGWIVLVVSLLLPLAYRLEAKTHYTHRLAVVSLMFAPTFIILTISYEALFYIAFCTILFLWLRLEYAAQRFLDDRQAQETKANRPNEHVRPAQSPRPLQLSDARVALFFMVFLQSAFFSTGNVASVSSFSLDSVYRLIPIFDPISQGALLVLKLMIPFVLISAYLGVLNKRLGVAPSALFMVVMAVSDILTLYFFWVVKDEGSWLEIGSTISHFAIASILCVFVAGLEGVSAVLIAGVHLEHDNGGNGGQGAEAESPSMAGCAELKHTNGQALGHR